MPPGDLGCDVRSLYIRLEARAPARNCFRAYQVSAGLDLIGIWLVEMTYGRIGGTGRTQGTVLRQFLRCLGTGQRAIAPKRIGTFYFIQALERDALWREVEVGFAEAS